MLVARTQGRVVGFCAYTDNVAEDSGGPMEAGDEAEVMAQFTDPDGDAR